MICDTLMPITVYYHKMVFELLSKINIKSKTKSGFNALTYKLISMNFVNPYHIMFQSQEPLIAIQNYSMQFKYA